MPDQPTPALLAAARAYAEATWGYDAPYWTPRDRENHIGADALGTAEQPWFAALWAAGLAEGRRQATEGWERSSDAEEIIAREYGYFLLQEGAAERTGDFAEWIVGHLAEAGFEVRRWTPDGEREWGIWVPDLRDGHVLACDYEAHAREVLAGSGPGPVVVSRLVGPWEPERCGACGDVKPGPFCDAQAACAHREPAEQSEAAPEQAAAREVARELLTIIPAAIRADVARGEGDDDRLMLAEIFEAAQPLVGNPVARPLVLPVAKLAQRMYAEATAEPASGGVVVPSGPLTAEEATPDRVVPVRGDHDRVTVKAIQRALAGLKAGGPIVLGDAIPALPETLTVHLDNRDARFTPGDPPVPFFEGDEALPPEPGTCAFCGVHGTVRTVHLGEPSPPEGEALGVTDEHRHDFGKAIGDLRDRYGPRRQHDAEQGEGDR